MSESIEFDKLFENKTYVEENKEPVEKIKLKKKRSVFDSEKSVLTKVDKPVIEENKKFRKSLRVELNYYNIADPSKKIKKKRIRFGDSFREYAFTGDEKKKMRFEKTSKNVTNIFDPRWWKKNYCNHSKEEKENQNNIDNLLKPFYDNSSS